MSDPAGIGVEPDTPGHLFIADRGNSRIDELDAWGQFKRAWGWEVVQEGPGDDAPLNATQELTVSATAGTYALGYFDRYRGNFSKVTLPISFDATNAEVEAALVQLPTFDPGDVSVGGGPGDAAGSSPYEIEFTGSYADTAIPKLEVASTTLTGGSGASVRLLRQGGSFEVCVPAAGDVCRSGQGGGFGPGGYWGVGPIGGVAVDGGGVYVFETTFAPAGGFDKPSFRVQKFDNEGHFLLMWGGEVNETTHADRCTAADLEAGDVCGPGVPGTTPGRFDGGRGIAVGPEGNVFVGDSERIQKFDPEGQYLGEVAIPGKTVLALAIDSSGNFYVTFPEADVHKLSPAGAELAKFEAISPESVAAGSGGRLYTTEFTVPELGAPRILGFEANGACFICKGDDFGAMAGTAPNGLAVSRGACGIVGEDLYVSFAPFGSAATGSSFVRAYGPPPDPTIPGCEPPKVPPSIEDQYAASVGTDTAVLRATINPHFWSGPVLGPTSYYLQYATAACIEAGGWEAACVQAEPAAPGKALAAGAVDAGVTSGPIALSGLQPGTAYHYRFIAESPGGGSVVGKGGTPGNDGAEGRFATFAPPPGPQGACENEALRSGPAAFLPDCRAYEMVSPVDKDNGDVVVLTDGGQDPIALNQSSSDGDAFTYSSFRAFADPLAAPISSQYMARRGESGWQSEALDPPRGPAYLEIIQSLNHGFKAFSPDLCTAWVFHEDESPTLSPGAVEGFANLYRRQECGPEAGSYTALTTIAPPNRPRDRYIPELLGLSADGSKAIFDVADALPGTGASPGDPGDKGFGLYEAYGEGQLRFVCILPDGTPDSGCTAGTNTAVISYGRGQMVHNAISDDGERIFWSDAPHTNPGLLYVRIKAKKTVRLSSDPATFWTAAADGSAAVFTTGDLSGNKGELHRYAVGAEDDVILTEKAYGVLGASEDANRIYFASGEVLDEAPNSEGESAEAGKANVYLWQGGKTPTYTFIATLSGEDLAGGYSPRSVQPDRHAAQFTADGLAGTFMSTAPLTGADNTDLASGKPNAEVFHYDATSGQLTCASCSPTNARPRGRQLFESSWAAARIPATQTEVYQVPRVLSEDGGRLFFESFQPLVASDTNGSADVYEWERPGKGTCTTSTSTYSPTASGCVSLISSGQSPTDSTIADVSPTGGDVFFATASRLLPGRDPDDLIDVYDARVLGGFPEPPQPPAPCEGEACQSPPAPPNDPTPASAGFLGAGNVKGGTAKPRCRKPKVRRKGRCVRRHPKHRRATQRQRSER